MCEGLQSVNGAEDHDGMGCIHALHLPGLGAELVVTNVTFSNYEAAMYPGGWAVGIVGGYTVDCSNITYKNVSRPITVKIGFSGRVDTAGILNDLDGTLAGVPGGSVVPYTGQASTHWRGFVFGFGFGSVFVFVLVSFFVFLMPVPVPMSGWRQSSTHASNHFLSRDDVGVWVASSATTPTARSWPTRCT